MEQEGITPKEYLLCPQAVHDTADIVLAWWYFFFSDSSLDMFSFSKVAVQNTALLSIVMCVVRCKESDIVLDRENIIHI